MKTLLKLMGNELTADQHAQLSEASLREFQVGLQPPAEISDRLYFLYIDTDTQKVLASGYLKRIYPVYFDGETLSFVNIGSVIANEKGKGYGKQIMMAMREHLLAHDLTGLGFCIPFNQGFYEKCNFEIERNSTHRFIYLDGDQRVTEPLGQYILYLESSERFMEHILSNPVPEVFVPEATIW